jgi:hypothetical protein
MIPEIIVSTTIPITLLFMGREGSLQEEGPFWYPPPDYEEGVMLVQSTPYI